MSQMDEHMGEKEGNETIFRHSRRDKLLIRACLICRNVSSKLVGEAFNKLASVFDAHGSDFLSRSFSLENISSMFSLVSKISLTLRDIDNDSSDICKGSSYLDSIVFKVSMTEFRSRDTFCEISSSSASSRFVGT